MLLAALNLGLHTAACLRPLADVGRHFFVGTLISQLFILVMPPELLQLLLLKFVGREVRKVAGRALELVHSCELHLLLGIRIKRFESRLVLCTLHLAEVSSCVRETNRRASFCGNRSTGRFCVLALPKRHIVDGSQLRRHHTVLFVRLLHYGQLVVTLLDGLDGGIELLTKRLVLVVLNANGARLDVRVVRPLRVFGVIHCHQLLSCLVVNNMLALIHGLVE